MNFDLTFQQFIAFGEIGGLANVQRLVDLESEQTLDSNLLRNQTGVIAQGSQQKLKNVPSSHVQLTVNGTNGKLDGVPNGVAVA